MDKNWNIIVVGGGHAGCEAACAAARKGCKTLLVTMSRATIGAMSCNPAIGGIGKGQLVKEIDALGGMMAQAADYACILYRLLNRRKGAAVHGPRGQSDRALYQQYVQHFLKSQNNLTIAEAEVVDLIVQHQHCQGIRTASGEELSARAVILTTGTFLRGCIFQGTQRIAAGRHGEATATQLAKRLLSYGLELGRLKTGTPPRLDRHSIDYHALTPQLGDDEPHYFSMLTETTQQQQIPCHITYTNTSTHEIILRNLGHAPAYDGSIVSKGPRYCPSIEDKLHRFADKTSHQIFLEPDGLNSDLVYPNGISTSIDIAIQDQFLHTIQGLERVKVVQYGYAIEYDYIDPKNLSLALELHQLPGLFLAGQINGSTGYEEAAAQGIMAGLNAANRYQELPDLIIARHEGYIGVMIDDLTQKGIHEPYRMFTSRAEFRLRLRADNAPQRLCPIAIEQDCLDTARMHLYQKQQQHRDLALNLLHGLSASPHQLRALDIPVNQDGVVRSAYTWLSFPQISFDELIRIWPELATIAPETRQRIALDCHYAHYTEVHEREIIQLRKEVAISIPRDTDFSRLDSLSHEVRQLLTQNRPQTLGAAAKIQGITPSALTHLMLLIQSNKLPRLNVAEPQ